MMSQEQSPGRGHACFSHEASDDHRTTWGQSETNELGLRHAASRMHGQVYASSLDCQKGTALFGFTLVRGDKRRRIDVVMDSAGMKAGCGGEEG